MPYKSERIRIAGTEYDQRIKITDDQKRAITILYQHSFSQRLLAKLFHISKTSVSNILHPDKPRADRMQHDRAYWNAAKQRYRKRKQELYKKGLIK